MAENLANETAFRAPLDGDAEETRVAFQRASQSIKDVFQNVEAINEELNALQAVAVIDVGPGLVVDDDRIASIELGSGLELDGSNRIQVSLGTGLEFSGNSIILSDDGSGGTIDITNIPSGLYSPGTINDIPGTMTATQWNSTTKAEVVAAISAVRNYVDSVYSRINDNYDQMRLSDLFV